MNILTSEERSDYERDGFIIIRKLFPEDEITLLGKPRERTTKDKSSFHGRWRGKCGAARPVEPSGRRNLRMTSAAANSSTGSRTCSMTSHHYHSKMVLKDAQVGGYWPAPGLWILVPERRALLNLCSVMIAVDKATGENGCMQKPRARTSSAGSTMSCRATRRERTWNAWRKPRNDSNWFMRPWIR